MATHRAPKQCKRSLLCAPVLRGAAYLCMTRNTPGQLRLSQLQHATVERQVTFVEKVLGRTIVTRHDPLLSERPSFI